MELSGLSIFNIDNTQLDYRMPEINAIILEGSLKTSSEISNTGLLSEFFAKHLLTYGVRSEIIRLIDYDIRPGVYTRVDSDDWPAIYEKIMVTDIVVFATPVWWGIQSSLTQRVIERLDEIHDEIMESGKSKLTNKVAGIIVTAQMELNILLVT
jgi:multimeric flavodoxin WrbA